MAVFRVLSDRLIDIAWIARASVDLIRVDLTLRRSGFQDMLVLLDRIETRNPSALRPRDVRRAQRHGRQIAMAAKVSLPRVKCLHRSLVLHMWLRREGLPSELRIGVRKRGAELRAHAWVEMAGVALNDSPRALIPFVVLQPLEPRVAADLMPDTTSIDLRNAQWR